MAEAAAAAAVETEAEAETEAVGSVAAEAVVRSSLKAAGGRVIRQIV